jgi:hypothetical protein
MSDNTDDNENISFCIDDTSEMNAELDVSQFLGYQESDADADDDMTSIMLDYQLNMTVRQLLQICDYYGIAKGLKTNKSTKDEIICLLINFENTAENYEIVSRRRLMWFYIEELKNDKLMKKYIFW